MILSSHRLSAPDFFQLLSISHRTRMRIVVIYDVIILRLRLLFSRILIDYENNENKTPSKIYTITVAKTIKERKKDQEQVREKAFREMKKRCRDDHCSKK